MHDADCESTEVESDWDGEMEAVDEADDRCWTAGFKELICAGSSCDSIKSPSSWLGEEDCGALLAAVGVGRSEVASVDASRLSWTRRTVVENKKG